MNNNIIFLLNLETVSLYLDKKKNILTFDILNSNYSKNNSITVLEYFKNFWILAKEQCLKYFLIIKINSIGIYPLSFYSNLINCLKELDNIFKEHLHSCCFLSNNINQLKLLKPLFNVYKFVRPYKICNTYDEILIYFNNDENKIKE